MVPQVGQLRIRGDSEAVVQGYVDQGYRMMEIQVISQIMRHWFGPAPAGVVTPWRGYPDNYVVFDTETSGRDFRLDLILEFGWAIVSNRQVVDTAGVIINWYGHPAVDWSDLCRRMESCRVAMANKGRTYHFTPERLLAEGVPYDIALPQIHDILLGAMRGLTIGHNFWSFDRNMLDSLRVRFVDGQRYEWPVNSIFDTGMAERASQLNRVPWSNDTMASWHERVSKPPYKGVRWALDDWMTPKYNLAKRYNLNTDMAHTAGADCCTTHAAFDTFRLISEGQYVG